MRLSRSEALNDWSGYALAVLITAIATGISTILSHHIALANLVMVYLLGVTYVATRCSPRPAILASLLGVAAFDFFFVPPGGTFAVADVEYLITFGVMLAVSLMISTLTVRLRETSEARHEAALKAQVESMRGDLLSAVSHDLRTPLSSIEGSASALLTQPELAEPSRQLAATIQGESARMARLIRNLLDMTRVQGLIELDLDWYGLDELVANAIYRTEHLFETPVTLTVEGGSPLARVDGVLMEQVIVNLLENSARHAGGDSTVRVGIRPEPGGITVTVSDSGPGLAPGSEERVFERFQGTKGKGVGLGLAICRAAVEAHGGHISAQSRPEGGALFTIQLPAEEGTQVA